MALLIAVSLALVCLLGGPRDGPIGLAGGSEPPVYVIQDEQPLGAGGLHSARSWNNQRLAVRKHERQVVLEHQDHLAPGHLELAADEPGQAGSDGERARAPLLPFYSSYKLDYQRLLSSHYMSPLESASEASEGSSSEPLAAVKGQPRTAAGRARGQVKGRRRKEPRPREWTGSRKGSAEAPVGAPARRTLLQGETPGAGNRSGAKRKNIVCYYGTWAVYRPDAGRFAVENIDPFLCTHLIYGFTGLSYDSTIKPLDPYNDLEENYGKGAMKRFTNLKRINPDLKTLVAIGGWNEGSIKYSKMASDGELRARFIRSVLAFLDRYNFDGLDLDWEYPGARGGWPADKQNYVLLLRELSEAFRARGYLLTAAVAAGKSFMDGAYEVGQVSRYLDLINLMAYDYHGGWEPKTGMNAPLYASRRHDSAGANDYQLNVNWSVNYWLQQGAPAHKIMLGVGSYGRSFTLDRAHQNGINAPASQRGRAGPYTREPGTLGYNEICEAFKRQPRAWTIVRDPDYLAPYAYHNNERQWVGYDDPHSLALKSEYAKSMGLGGVMMWSIETDDFQGRCQEEKYPLLNTIRRSLNGPAPPGPPLPSTTRRPTPGATPGHEIEDEPGPGPGPSTARPAPPPPPSSTRRPAPLPGTGAPDAGRPASGRPRPASTASSTTTTTTTTSSTTRRPPTPGQVAEFQCRDDGMFADPANCRKFIRCVGSGAGYSTFRFDCAPGTAFDEQHGYCDYIHNVPSCHRAAGAGPASVRRRWPVAEQREWPEQAPQPERDRARAAEQPARPHQLRSAGLGAGQAAAAAALEQEPELYHPGAWYSF